jgi:hypothetical protein
MISPTIGNNRFTVFNRETSGRSPASRLIIHVEDLAIPAIALTCLLKNLWGAIYKA